MDVSATTWNTLSTLLDEALDLEPAARGAWLDRQVMTRPDLAGPLRRLLAAHATSETADLLAELPAIGSAACAEDSPHADLAAGDRIGPYHLERKLGSGGMADVWLAKRADGAFSRDVALKLPHIGVLRHDLAFRFARERDILARLENPHIARFYDAGVAGDGLPYLAMEFVDGRPINDDCDARRLDVTARLRLFAQVLDAVQYAHANLVIHRDLKPTNVLVAADGQVRLLDFGIAKLLAGEGSAIETRQTQVGGRMLTPDYASPEQVMGGPLTIASDVYSLGVVLYELLCGQRPYRLKVKSVAQVEQAIVMTDPPKPSASSGGEAAAELRSTTPRKLARRLAGDLDTIVLKALAKAPAERYATTADLAEDLRRHVAGEPVRARPASWHYRASRFVARNALASIAAAAMGVALIAAASVSLWQAQQARVQAQLAVEQTQLARAQAARAEEVKKFVLSVLRASDADRGGGRQTTAIDLLKQARERLDAAPIADEAIRAELLSTIGNGLLGLGELRSAAAVLSEAIQLGSAVWGERDRMTADARVAYGFALLNLGDWKLATVQFDVAEGVLRSLGNLALLARVLRGRSALASNEGDYDSAIDLAREAVDASERVGDKNELIASCMRLSSLLVAAGRDGSLEPARRAFALAREPGGHLGASLMEAQGVHSAVAPDAGNIPSVLLLEAQTTYLSALAVEDDRGRAEGHLRRALRHQQAMLGHDNIQIAVTLGRLGVMSWRIGDPFTAIDRFREALGIYTNLSSERPTRALAITRARLSNVLASVHRDEEALDGWREVERLYSVLYGNEHVTARMARSGAASTLIKLGRLDEADSILTGLLATMLGGAAEEAIVMGGLTLLRGAQGRHMEALGQLGKLRVAIGEAPLERPRALSPSEYGRVLLAGGRAAESLDLLQQARTRLLVLHRDGSPDLADIALGIAQAQIALGRLGEAAAAADEAAMFWKRFNGYQRNHGIALLWFARAHAAAGNANEASQALRGASGALIGSGSAADRLLMEQTRREVGAQSGS